MSDFKNHNLGEDLPVGNNGLTMSTMEVAKSYATEFIIRL